MLYTDPIYGSIDIHEPVILELINSPTIQRLKGIDQAGYFHVYFPDAIPRSRFNHSLGVYILLQRYGAPLEEQIAGLIHDVSHGTFSHCLDYVFKEGNQKTQDHQDNIFESFIKKSDIPAILRKYHLDIDYIIDDTNFPLKETTLPDLCADRIDYVLRDAGHNRESSSEEISYLLDHLVVKDRTWLFADGASAEKFTALFRKINDTYYTSLEAAAMYQTVGDCLTYARKKLYLQADDFYTTDKQVLDKITAHIESDPQLAIYWQRMNNKIPYANDPNNFDYHIFCKNRVIDPLCICEDTIKRVSEIDHQWKIILETEPKAKEYFLKFKQ